MLLLRVSYTTQVWAYFKSKSGSTGQLTTLDQVVGWAAMHCRGNSMSEGITMSASVYNLPIGTVYNLWRERNSRVFQKLCPGVPLVIAGIERDMRSCINCWRHVNKMIWIGFLCGHCKDSEFYIHWFKGTILFLGPCPPYQIIIQETNLCLVTFQSDKNLRLYYEEIHQQNLGSIPMLNYNYKPLHNGTNLDSIIRHQDQMDKHLTEI